jgi:hypothetical protein
MLQRGEDIKFSKTTTTIRHYLLGPPFLTVRGQTTHTHTHTHTSFTFLQQQQHKKRYLSLVLQLLLLVSFCLPSCFMERDMIETANLAACYHAWLSEKREARRAWRAQSTLV